MLAMHEHVNEKSRFVSVERLSLSASLILSQFKVKVVENSKFKEIRALSSFRYPNPGRKDNTEASDLCGKTLVFSEYWKEVWNE